jgi:hypothetical protein
MHRKLKTVGILDWKRCNGTLLIDPRQQRVASALKSLGFQETRWQFVYGQQLLGLVLPYNDGKNEVHLRFYHDRIFAEYEVGRASLAHFFGPFLNANKFIAWIVESGLSDGDYSYLLSMTDRVNLRHEERALSDWDFLADALEVGSKDYGNILSFRNADRFSGVLSWKFLINGPLAIASVLTLTNTLWLPFAATIGAFLILFISLPQVGRP